MKPLIPIIALLLCFAAHAATPLYSVGPDTVRIELRDLTINADAQIVNVLPGTAPLDIVVTDCVFNSTRSVVMAYNSFGQNRDIRLTYRRNQFTAKPGVGSTQAIYIRENCSHARIEDSTFRGCYQDAIAIGVDKASHDVRDVVIARNRIYDTWASQRKECKPIFVRGGDVHVLDNVIIGNHGHPARDNDAIYVAGNQVGNVIRGNVLHNAGNWGIQVKSGNAIVTGNIVTIDDDTYFPGKTNGVSVSGAGNVVVANNRISGATWGLFHQSGRADVLYQGNLVSHCKYGAIIKGGTNNDHTYFVGNVFRDARFKVMHPDEGEPVQCGNVIIEK